MALLSSLILAASMAAAIRLDKEEKNNAKKLRQENLIVFKGHPQMERALLRSLILAASMAAALLVLDEPWTGFCFRFYSKKVFLLTSPALECSNISMFFNTSDISSSLSFMVFCISALAFSSDYSSSYTK